MSTRDDLIAIGAEAMYHAIAPPDHWWEGEELSVHEYWRVRAAAVIDALGIERVAALSAEFSGEIDDYGSPLMFPCSPVFRIRALEGSDG